MGLLRLVSGAVLALRFLLKGVVVIVMTIAGWTIIQNMVQSGQLPPEPLGLAAMGFPRQVMGLPTAYAGGIILFDALVLFGNGGGGSTTGGGFGGAGGGGDGGGGGGGGGGDGP